MNAENFKLNLTAGSVKKAMSAAGATSRAILAIMDKVGNEK